MLAHEFWLQPARFIYQPGDRINIRFWVGEDFDGINWGGNREKVASLQRWVNGKRENLANHISDKKGDSLQFIMHDEGTPMITFNSINSYIELDSAKFNAYLEEDGLTGALAYRAAHHETSAVGREFYQRSVKTLIQVGNKKSNISNTTGLPLDIVPLINPYALKNNDSLGVQILFNNTPLANHLVNVWHRQHGQTIRRAYHTDPQGRLSFLISTSGKWMVSAVNMVHITDTSKADWQSYWGSCTWGYE